MNKPPFPGIRITATGNHLVSLHTECRLAEAGVFYPITPSTEMGEIFQQSFAEGKLNVFGRPKVAVEAEGEHAAQGGAIAYSVTGKRVVNFTSGQGLVYGVEQYYHAPGKLSTLVVQVAARALTKHALNVHCGHDDFYAALDTGWIMLMARDAQQAADQALISRKVAELSLTPAMNIQDGFLTSHIERTFLKPESELIRQFMGAPEDIIDCPTPAQVELFGPTRRRVPEVITLQNPVQLGPVQNQEHYMNGVIARRNNFAEPILGFLEDAWKEFGELTGRTYGPVTEYNADGAETVFVSLGSAAENIEAVADYLAETRGEQLGSIHINLIRPFPEDAVVKALAGRKNVIIIERTDEALSGDNPLTRDIRAAMSKALERGQHGIDDGRPAITADQMPRIFSGSYGLGSRDFRPEGIIGAYEFALGQRGRRDGAMAADGTNYFTVGIEHPYDVRADETPSLLPDGSISVRFHSIGGWGMITTGKNLGAIIGAFGSDLAERNGVIDDTGNLEEVIHISANPKYGSEKKGSPTAYFLVVAPERIRVNCDLRHVDVVLCCDPKAFTHTNPIAGLKPGGALVWESDEPPERAWKQIPIERRKEIIEKGIRIFTLPGFEIARNATNRADLQLRMQGNAFLGAFFKVSSFLGDYAITEERFEEVVRNQYVKKFGRFGDAVIESNMQVMKDGFGRVSEVPQGDVDAEDISEMRGNPLLPSCGTSRCGTEPKPEKQAARPNLAKLSYFETEYRGGFGYNQPASALSAVGVVAAAAGAVSSKYVARRETPVYIQENCTQCMECISVCPDTALPNMAQDIDTVLMTAVGSYVTDSGDKERLLAAVPEMQTKAREQMKISATEKQGRSFVDIISGELSSVDVSDASKSQLVGILKRVPLAYNKSKAIFSIKEKKEEGSGGLFSIFVSDLCKGCAACVTACGSHEALKMVPDSEQVNEDVVTAMGFLDLFEDTEQKFLGKYDNQNPQDAKAGVLRNHLMVRKNYEGLVSGDGACAGCGEKSVMRSLATVTEAYMRPMYHRKAERLTALAHALQVGAADKLAALAKRSPEEYTLYKRAVAHLLIGLGGEDPQDTDARFEAHGEVTDAAVIEALVTVLHQDSFNHQHLQANEGRTADGMSVMAMAAHTGCNTVFGSTPPNNPHPYPWMNSLFQDGATVGWMFGESFIIDHARRSVIPERLGRCLMERDEEVMSQDEFDTFKYMTDAYMTDQEIAELPKAWIIGGDGGMGDIGFQNVSKVVLQNRPNVKLLMLDTQVYSNTGGQNSDSSPMPGGGDMNGLGKASQGKLVEKKSVAEILTAGHGSPFVAQLSMANATRLYRALLDGLEYRGTAFFQCFTTCQPEHGVPDDASEDQAKRIRDGRGMPDFVFNPQKGERYTEAFDLRGNLNVKDDWGMKSRKANRDDKYRYTTAHWASTEARFRRHFRRIDASEAEGLILIDDMLARLSQQDAVYRRYLNTDHRSFIPDFGVYIVVDDLDGEPRHMVVSRQVVLFCVERRKAWRMLQSKAGVENTEYEAHQRVLAQVDAGEVELAAFLADSAAMVKTERENA